MYAVSKGSPLSFGMSSLQKCGEKMQNDYYLASDPLAFCEWANYVIYPNGPTII